MLRQILDSSKLKGFTDGYCKVDENGGKSSKRLENALGKGVIKTSACLGKG